MEIERIKQIRKKEQNIYIHIYKVPYIAQIKHSQCTYKYFSSFIYKRRFEYLHRIHKSTLRLISLQKAALVFRSHSRQTGRAEALSTV